MAFVDKDTKDTERAIDIEHRDGWETYFRVNIKPMSRALADLADESGLPLGWEDVPSHDDGPVLVISFIQLHPMRRGYGWGRRFVQAAQRWGKSKGATSSMLFAGRTGEDSPFHSVFFWQRLGYEVIAGSNNDDAVLFKAL